MKFLKYFNVNTISLDKDVSQETIQNNAENLKIAQINLVDHNKGMSKEYDLICRFTNGNPRFFSKQELRYAENTNMVTSQINWPLM